jgi:dihydrofolate reductase
MSAPRISIIVAIGKNRELGKGNELIWRISADLKRVKELTTGHPIIMGRKTYESIGRPLPNRTNIVISRSQTEIEGCFVFDSLERGVAHAKEIEAEEIFIFGGASIYKEALPFVDRLYLTLIDAEDRGADTFFPEYSMFKIKNEEKYLEHTPPYSWQILERKQDI